MKIEDSLEHFFNDIATNVVPQNLYIPVNYIMSQGGKRLRPQLVLLAAELFGAKAEDAFYPATAFEMLHNFTLIHDDIMDNAPIRRGKETVYKKWNSNIAILSGDVLASMAMQQLLKTPCAPETLIKMSELFMQTSIEICEGQQYDLDFETQEEVTIDEYLNMIRLKTAVMLAGCLKISTILANASEHDQNTLYQFGINLGLAFQLVDDLLDVYADTETFGKELGGDIQANKKTYPYLLALQKANEAQKAQLQHYFSSNHYDKKEKFNAVKTIFDELRCKEDTEKIVEDFLEKAYRNIEELSLNSEQMETLKELALKLSKRSK
ncbi:MAG: polyprenyl synthetase family protein [Bacteroidetes bacterium]|nr:polyprenyl synthetase family protein [Bacteroidota bacterium]MCL2301971.1 polyprenyl synthetase family protein [Lentimicrobiaceae bacterium]